MTRVGNEQGTKGGPGPAPRAARGELLPGVGLEQLFEFISRLCCPRVLHFGGDIITGEYSDNSQLVKMFKQFGDRTFYCYTVRVCSSLPEQESMDRQCGVGSHITGALG